MQLSDSPDRLAPLAVIPDRRAKVAVELWEPHGRQHAGSAVPKDVARLKAALPKGVVVFEKEVPTYAHMDFTWGATANVNVYKDLIWLLSKY